MEKFMSMAEGTFSEISNVEQMDGNLLNNLSQKTQCGISIIWAGMNTQLRVLLKRKY